MVLNCSQQLLRNNKMVIETSALVEAAILVGLAVNVYLAWRIKQDVNEIEEVVVQMLLDLGDQGILKVEVDRDDS
jgi:pyrimidine operon attenuation protein/uracil phosphoribosyltransferase